MSVNDKDEVIEGQFQMPPKVFQSMFGSTMKLSVDNNHETSSTSSEVYDTNPLEKLNHFRAGFCNLVFSKLVLSF